MTDPAGRESTVTAGKIIIATGTRPARPDSVDFDERTIIDSDGMIHLEKVPNSMVVVGAGVIGIEYASMFAALGTKVTVVERRSRMLEFCDLEIVEALKYHLRDLAVTFRFSEAVGSVERHPRGAIAVLESGKRVAADTVMYSAGRQGTAGELRLENAGLAADNRGRIAVDAHFRTTVPHIYAVGDVIGFPALASTSMEQGRLAAHHACDEAVRAMPELQPIGIYTIPEISFIGRTEEELTEGKVPFEAGVARYRELARGQIIGDSYGMLKLLVAPDTGRLLGVHPDAGRGVQGGGAGRDEQDAGHRPAPRLIPRPLHRPVATGDRPTGRAALHIGGAPDRTPCGLVPGRGSPRRPAVVRAGGPRRSGWCPAPGRHAGRPPAAPTGAWLPTMTGCCAPTASSANSSSAARRASPRASGTRPPAPICTSSSAIRTAGPRSSRSSSTTRTGPTRTTGGRPG
ncbi:FAD-dependent oxidoreductase [Micromonospora zhanjiangensis]